MVADCERSRLLADLMELPEAKDMWRRATWRLRHHMGDEERYAFFLECLDNAVSSFRPHHEEDPAVGFWPFVWLVSQRRCSTELKQQYYVKKVSNFRAALALSLDRTYGDRLGEPKKQKSHKLVEPTSPDNVEEEVCYRDLVRGFVGALKGTERIVAVDRINGYGMNAISARRGLSNKAVDNASQRIKRKLLRYLAEQ